MRVTVFGATGSIGQVVVQQLLDTDHEVTAMVRNPVKLSFSHPHLAVITGELSDMGAVRNAVAGAEAVISALGPPVARYGPGTPLTEGTRNILVALKTEQVKRFIGISSPMLIDSHDIPRWVHKVPGWVGRILYPYTLKEMTGMVAAITNADVDYTILRLTRPVDKPPTGVFKSGYLGRDKLGWSMRRSDLAAFIVSQLTDTRYVRAMPVISN